MGSWKLPVGLVTALGLIIGYRTGPVAPLELGFGLGTIVILVVLAVSRIRRGHFPLAPLIPLMLGFVTGSSRAPEVSPSLPTVESTWIAGRIQGWDARQRGVRIRLEAVQLGSLRLTPSRPVVVFADTSWGRTPRSGWIALEGKVLSNRGVTTPGSWSPADRAATVLARRGSRPVWGPGKAPVFCRWRAGIRSRLGEEFSGFPRRFAVAIMLGDSGVLSADERSVFRRTGTSHLTAVSGLHVGLVAMLAGLVLGGAPRTVRWAGVILCAWCYAGLAGWAASALRAATLVAGVTLGAVLHRPRPGYHWLSLAVVWLLWAGPDLAGSVSFQLSVAAVTGILLFIEVFGLNTAQGIRWISPAVISLGAQWGTLPVAVGVFGMLSPLSLIPNLVAVPIAALFLPAVLGSLAAGSVPVISETLQAAASALALLLWWFLSEASERLPFWQMLPAPPGISLPILFGVSVLWFASPSSLRASRRFRGLVILGMAMTAGLCFLPRPGPPGPWFAFLDVGQGDAAVCRLSDGTVWVIDVGDIHGSVDAARLFILPFLRRQRIRSVDGLILSHRHRDHVGGLATLLETVPVRRVFDAGHGGIRGTPGWVDSVLAHHGQTACLVASGDTLHAAGAITIVALHPGRSDPFQDHVHRNLNNASLVVRLQDGNMSILFAGDAEREAEEMLLREPHLLRSRVLKVGHHGSRTSSSMAFLEAVCPELAVISCGEGNRFSHPAGETLAALDSLGIPFHRSDRDGSTLVSLRDGELRIRIHPPRWRCP